MEDKPMTRDEVLQSLREHESELRAMGVASLSLFGSLARAETTKDSDIDLLIEFERPVGYFHVFHVQDFLEECFGGTRVHLVLRNTVIDELKEIIHREAVHVIG